MGAIREASELLRLARELSAWLKGEKDDSLRIECMNGLGIYTTTVQVESRFSKWAQKIGSRSRKFSKDLVYDVRLYSVKPTLGRIDGAVFSDGDSIVVD